MAAGFLDYLNDPSGESQMVLGAILKGMATGQGPGAGAALAEHFEKKREADRIRADNVGMLTAIMSGDQDFAGIAQRNPKAEHSLMVPLASRRITEDEKASDAKRTSEAFGKFQQLMRSSPQTVTMPVMEFAADGAPVETQVAEEIPGAAPTPGVPWNEITQEAAGITDPEAFLAAQALAKEGANSASIIDQRTRALEQREASLALREKINEQNYGMLTALSALLRERRPDLADALGTGPIPAAQAGQLLQLPDKQILEKDRMAGFLTRDQIRDARLAARQDKALGAAAGRQDKALAAAAARGDQAAADRAAAAQARRREKAQAQLDKLRTYWAGKPEPTGDTKKALEKEINRLKDEGAE